MIFVVLIYKWDYNINNKGKGDNAMWFDKQPQWLRIVLIILFNALTAGLYRIFAYTKSKNTVTLVAGILCLFGLGFLVAIVDLVTTITDDKITFLAD